MTIDAVVQGGGEDGLESVRIIAETGKAADAQK